MLQVTNVDILYQVCYVKAVEMSEFLKVIDLVIHVVNYIWQETNGHFMDV